MNWDDTRYLSPEEVSNLLGIKVDTVYRHARRGTLPGTKVGHLWRFAEADVREAMTRGRSRAAPADATASTTPRLLPQLLRHAAGGDTRGVVCGSARMSYDQIDRASDRLAGALIAQGVAPGDRIVAVLPTSMEFLVTAFAVWKARAVLVPEYRGIDLEDLLRVLEEATPTALVVDDAVAERLGSARDRLPRLRAVFVKDLTFTLSGWNEVAVESLDAAMELGPTDPIALPTGASSDEVVSITYTSGSTGTPKGVVHTHESWLAGAAFTRDHHRLEPGDRILIPLPLHHGLAFRQVLAYLLARGSLVIAADVYQGLRLLATERPSAMVLVPAACEILAHRFPGQLEPADAHLRYIEVGSASIATSTLQELARVVPTTPVHMAYGLTEVRVGYLKRGHDGLLNRIGRVAPDLEITVEDPEGARCAAETAGEIVIRGRGLLRGYWNTPEKGELHALHTGDLGRVDREGEIELLGRLDDVLESGERRIIPLELETCINRHPAVVESAVVAESGLPAEEGIHAFVVSREGFGLDETELLAHCREHLASWPVMPRIHLRTSLPKSPVGKILRRELSSSIAVS